MATKSTNPFSEFLPPATSGSSGNASTSAAPLVKKTQDSQAEEIRRLALQPSFDAAAARTASLAPTQASLAGPPVMPGAGAVPFSGGATFSPPAVTAAPVSTSTLSQSDRTRAEAAAKTAALAPTTFQPATPSSGPDVSGLFAPVTQAPTTRPTEIGRAHV